MTSLWGFLSVGVMATAYAVKSRGRRWVLVFAIASLSAAGYAVVIESWPFAVVEALWSGVALRRWLGLRQQAV